MFFIRFVLVVLFAVFAISCRAAVHCEPVGDGSWVCSGDGSGGGGEGGEVVVTNYLGVCTNCVQMSQDYCNNIKSYGLEVSDHGLVLCQGVVNMLGNAYNDVRGLIAEGESFEPYPATTNSPAAKYSMNAGSSSTTSATASQKRVSANSIWNYYTTSVGPVLNDVSTRLYYAKQGVEEDIASSLRSVGRYFDSLDCSVCQSAAGDDDDDDDDGGGGGSGGGGACPCKDQIDALVNVLRDDLIPKVNNIRDGVDQLTNIVDIARRQLRATYQGFHDATNLLVRLDDYVLDDFSNRVLRINLDVALIASNLQNRVRSFIDQSYSNAQFYVTADDAQISMASLDSTLVPDGDLSKFDFDEFGNLPWFTRIEYLLLRMNGVYVSSNSVSDVGSDAKDNYDSIVDSFSSFQASVNGDLKSGFSELSTSIGGFFSAFNSVVSSSANNDTEVVLISSFLGDQPLVLNVPTSVSDACRSITSLLWTVLFGFLLYRLLLVFWVVFVDTVNWWVSQTQGFVK